MILTHPESDHLNGLIFILQNFKVSMLIKNTDVNDSFHYKMLMDTCKKKKIKVWHPVNETHLFPLGKTHLVFYSPMQDRKLYNYNNNSLVFKVVYKDFSMLFPGDILKKRELSLSRNTQMNLSSDVLLAPHHGSATSSNNFFLDKVQAKSVIISCGWRNRYAFPDSMVLKRYKNKKIKSFRTDSDGAVFISSDGADYHILTYKGR